MEIKKCINGKIVEGVYFGIFNNTLCYVKNAENETKIIIPENVEVIDKNVFSNLNKLKEVVLPEHLKKIGKHAFFRCRELKNVKMFNSVEDIEGFAFYGCEELDNLILSKNLHIIGDSAFSNTAIKNVIVPKSVISIGRNAFSYNNNLQNFQIENNSKIQELQFATCTACPNLQKIYVPKNIKIGYMCFDNCNNSEIIKTELEYNAKNGLYLNKPNVEKKIIL